MSKKKYEWILNHKILYSALNIFVGLALFTASVYGMCLLIVNRLNNNNISEKTEAEEVYVIKYISEATETISQVGIAHIAETHVLLPITEATGNYQEDIQVQYYVEPVVYDYHDIYCERHPVLVECSDEELEELAKLAYLEAGSDWISNDCLRAVIEVVFNQLNYGAWGSTLHEVIWSPGNYEPAPNIPYTEATERCRQIVRDVYENGIQIPARVMFFRAWYYHQWYGAIAEFEIDGVYFSSSWWCQ